MRQTQRVPMIVLAGLFMLVGLSGNVRAQVLPSATSNYGSENPSFDFSGMDKFWRVVS